MRASDMLSTRTGNHHLGSSRHRAQWRSTVVLVTLLLSLGVSAAPAAASTRTGAPSVALTGAHWSAAPLQVHPAMQAAPQADPRQGQPAQAAGCTGALSAGQAVLDALRAVSPSGPEAAQRSSAVRMLEAALASARAAMDAGPLSASHPAVASEKALQAACGRAARREFAARSLSPADEGMALWGSGSELAPRRHARNGHPAPAPVRPPPASSPPAAPAPTFLLNERHRHRAGGHAAGPDSRYRISQTSQTGGFSASRPRKLARTDCRWTHTRSSSMTTTPARICWATAARAASPRTGTA